MKKDKSKQCKHEWREILNQTEFYCIYCLMRNQINTNEIKLTLNIQNKIIIDCDASPFIPDGWSIRPEDQISSAVSGQLEFDPAKVAFHLDDVQKTGVVDGDDLRKRLEGKPVLKANVLDHLLANTDLIPESWKTDEQGRSRYIFFWGTIYRGSSGDLCVRYLCWNDGEWDSHYNWLGGRWIVQCPAAVLASS